MGVGDLIGLDKREEFILHKLLSWQLWKKYYVHLFIKWRCF